MLNGRQNILPTPVLTPIPAFPKKGKLQESWPRLTPPFCDPKLPSLQSLHEEQPGLSDPAAQAQMHDAYNHRSPGDVMPFPCAL